MKDWIYTLLNVCAIVNDCYDRLYRDLRAFERLCDSIDILRAPLQLDDVADKLKEHRPYISLYVGMCGVEKSVVDDLSRMLSCANGAPVLYSGRLAESIRNTICNVAQIQIISHEFRDVSVYDGIIERLRNALNDCAAVHDRNVEGNDATASQ